MMAIASFLTRHLALAGAAVMALSIALGCVCCRRAPMSRLLASLMPSLLDPNLSTSGTAKVFLHL